MLTNYDTNVEKPALSNEYIEGTSGNGHSFVNRREVRASHSTGALPIIKTPERSAGSGFDFGQMLESLHELFEHDRQVASQPDATRCGICYLHYQVSELHYRDNEGFYVCANCEQALGKHTLPMLRYQQKL
jgi:hypothetical protein